MRKCFVPLALAVAALYLTLSATAMACLFAHGSQPRSVHHTSGVTHSSLCAWACHANPTVDLPAGTSQTQPLHLVAMLLLVAVSPSSVLSQQSAQSRAPPRS